jgi:hypothetical protein
MRRAYNSAKHREKKMLASTVQFSTNNQESRPPDPARPDTPTGAPTVRDQTGPARTTNPPHRAVRSLRTQQRAYGPATHHHPVPHATGVTPYWEQQQLPAELVSVPPSSTTPGASVIRR